MFEFRSEKPTKSQTSYLLVRQHPSLMYYEAILIKLPTAEYSELNNTTENSLTNPPISLVDHYLNSILLYRPFLD